MSFVSSRRIFRKTQTQVEAVKDVTFEIKEHSTFGLVGESGSGKSTLGRIIAGLMRPTSGRVLFMDREISNHDGIDYDTRAAIQMIFQDSFSSFNPRKMIRDSVALPLRVRGGLSKPQIDDIVLRMLENVGISPAVDFASRYPHELSGGQRQRVSIARALVLGPRLVVADEPVSSLDVPVKAQILQLLRKTQEESKLSMLFISHDIATVRLVSHDIAVMYKGRFLEISTKDELFSKPMHPYTQLLMAAELIPDPAAIKKTRMESVNSSSRGSAPSGCVFFERCPHAMEICREKSPELLAKKPNHFVACWLY